MKKLLLLSFALLAFMACDLEEIVDNIEDSLSSFDASVTGAVTANFSGTAEFVNSSVESQTPQASSLAINMENKDDSSEGIIMGVVLADVLGGVQAGTYEYDIDQLENILISATYDNGQQAFLYPDLTATNQIVLTKVENTQIEGTFNFTLSNMAVGGDKINLTGSFKAIGITQTL